MNLGYSFNLSSVCMHQVRIKILIVWNFLLDAFPCIVIVCSVSCIYCYHSIGRLHGLSLCKVVNVTNIIHVCDV